MSHVCVHFHYKRDLLKKAAGLLKRKPGLISPLSWPVFADKAVFTERNTQIVAITGNLSLLFVFKYLKFIVENLSGAFEILGIAPLQIPALELPLGISFYTFHAISYLVDVYRKETSAQKNLFDLALYITFFPQAIAGPILRYKAIRSYLGPREITQAGFTYGCLRFIAGLGKKVLIANHMGYIADQIFLAPPNQMSFGVAWLAVIAYSLQIYFNFSGYSDMAVGLGRMFGFRFIENFDHPYVARSIQDFWRRWHISLSTWFRDYVYIPLGGSKRGRYTTYRNLLIVFVLCGAWHGANWTFVVWGLWHGLFLVLERTSLSDKLTGLWRPLQHLYVLLVIMLGWLLFRADSLQQVGAILPSLLGLGNDATPELILGQYATPKTLWVLLFGVILSTPAVPVLFNELEKRRGSIAAFGRSVQTALLVVIFGWSILAIVSSNYNPFIYYRF